MVKMLLHVSVTNPSSGSLLLCFAKVMFIILFIIIMFLAQQPPQWVMASSFTRFLDHIHTMTHHSMLDSSGIVIGQSQRPLPDNTQHSQQTDIHVPRWDSNPQSQQASGLRPTPDRTATGTGHERYSFGN